ncbi:subtilisin-like protein [Anaeromyces robustus]|uniref:Subtilisin-like protein n=1 Tax=Anaeromyces robustus TaxID=1754192 RepID=A0A1Y1XGX5_9FUNG|nr:subtilisin-like protein [Anaeromyces robustus]|eukprot:ORX84973.1 subtilisin-like protein [Anaeromyces robustus]
MMKLLRISFLFIQICLSFSKSIKNSYSLENKTSSDINNFLKHYIIVYKNVIENNLETCNNLYDENNKEVSQNEKHKEELKKHIYKRKEIHKNLESKYDLLTLKFPVRNSLKYKNSILKNKFQINDIDTLKDNENPILSKTFMFINENDIINEIYGNNYKDIHFNNKKKRLENQKYTLNEFIKTINSTEFPIDYIEEDFPVKSDDFMDNKYKHYINDIDNERDLYVKYNYDNMNQTLENNQIAFGNSIEIQKKKLDWGLDRIDQRKTQGDHIYRYPKHAGENVNVYILDTGLNFDHNDYKSRAFHGSNFIADESDYDLYGHGSYVAGIIGGKTYGVAKKANLISVKVLNKYGRGQASLVIKGLNWVINDHNNNKSNVNGAIANVSLGSIKSKAINDVVSLAKKNGILVITSAGNDSGDACSKSPASSNDG